MNLKGNGIKTYGILTVVINTVITITETSLPMEGSVDISEIIQNRKRKRKRKQKQST
jgi:hypothetical protein